MSGTEQITGLLAALIHQYCISDAATCQVGAIIGRGGIIVKQIREETNSRIRVCEGVPTCEDRVIVIAARDEDPEIEENNAQVS